MAMHIVRYRLQRLGAVLAALAFAPQLMLVEQWLRRLSRHDKGVMEIRRTYRVAGALDRRFF